jgi:hypothetical protein
MRQSIFILFGTIVVFGISSFQYIFQKISLEMETRSATSGKAAKVKATVFYSVGGMMVSYFTEPIELVIINNKKGELTIYNPMENTVLQQQNYLLGTETNQLYFFLENKKGDLGLSAMGYTTKSTRFEEGLKITDWMPPMNIAKDISNVELVHEKGNPIFMAYYGADGKALKKIYFYNYNQVSDNIYIPSAITQIDFKTLTDSIVTKTTYSAIRLNQSVEEQKLNFTVPSTAKVLSR